MFNNRESQRSTFLDLTEEEAGYFKNICSSARWLDRHAVIRHQGDPVESIYLLKSGWAACSVDLRDGQRQIVKVHLPTDLMGLPSLSLQVAAETLVAITPVEICTISLHHLATIFMTMPRLAAHLFLCSQQERIYLMDRLTSLGRLSAERRLAAFILHIHDRLVSAGGEAGRVDMPLTQSQIGDIVGLTPVHVNRTIQSLETDKLIVRKRAVICEINVEGLRNLSGLPPRVWTHEPNWARNLARAMETI